MKTDTIFNSTTFIDTRVKNLFVAQAERPAMSREINIARLTPFQRGLLVTDGTVTRLIEAYTLAPVEVVLLHQTKQTLCTEHIWLELSPGAHVIAREVVLQTPSIAENSSICYISNCAATLAKRHLGRIGIRSCGIGRNSAKHRTGNPP